MGSQTPILGLPFPVGTDRVMDGDNAIQALAENAERAFKRAYAERWTTVTQSVANGVWTNASLPNAATVTGDALGYSGSTVAVLKAGIYLASAQVTWGAVSNSRRGVQVECGDLSASPGQNAFQQVLVLNGTAPTISVCGLMFAAAGQFIRVMLFQDSGTAQSTGGSLPVRFNVAMIGSL